MSIRCGFFNSVNNDRKYNAEDMGRLFEGVISDGVFNTVSPKFKVTPVTGTMDLLVNNGKAWFHERYFEIYDPETISIRPTELNSRIDAVCICINTTESVRGGSIEVLEGTESQNPTKPDIPVENGIYYIPIAWITIEPNDIVSSNLEIVSNVGNNDDPVEEYRCPYSEPTLDPRRAVYAYEGESDLDPIINNQSGIIDVPGRYFDPPAPSDPGVWFINPIGHQGGEITYVHVDLNKPMSSDKYIIYMQPQYILECSPSTGEILTIYPLDNHYGYASVRDIYAAPRDEQSINIQCARLKTGMNLNYTTPYMYYVRYYYVCFEIKEEDQNE